MSGWIAETLIATMLLMCAVLLLRAPVRHAFGARAAYVLWIVPGLRLILPPMDFPSPVSTSMGASAEIMWTLTPAEPSGANWLFVVWAAGALLSAGWHVLAYRRFLRRALAGAVETRDGAIALVATDAVDGPAAAGLLTRRILLPRDFADRFTPAEREWALRHERLHHARGDLWANAAALGMLGLHWFNPIGYWAYRAFREDQELSCDDVVIAGSGAEGRAAYGAAMVKSAWGAAPAATCPMTRSHNLKRRLKMMKTHRRSAVARAGGMLSVGVLALVGLTLTATAGIAADPVVGTEKIIVKRLTRQGDFTATATELEKIIGEANAHCGKDVTSFDAFGGPTKSQPSRTRFIVCNSAGAPVDRLAAFEKARARLGDTTELNEAERTRVLSSLDAEIAKLRAPQ